MMNIDDFKETFQFLPGSNVPLYSQLAIYFKHQIQIGALKPGDKIISENELCDILNVSRTTVRLSLNRLVEEGLIIRYRGKGSFIAEQKLHRNINYMYNFTENIRDSGAIPSSIVMQCETVTAEEYVADMLELKENNKKIFRLVRLRCANKIPIIVETTSIPYYLCPGIEHMDFENVSLYETLQGRYALNICHAIETIEAVIIENDAASHLQCKQKMPGYKIERVSYLDNDYIFEYTKSITRADKCKYRLDLYNKKAQGKNNVDFERHLNF